MSERGAGRLIGDAAYTEVVTFRVTKSDRALLEQMRYIAGAPSIGHYCRALVLQRAYLYEKTSNEPGVKQDDA